MHIDSCRIDAPKFRLAEASRAGKQASDAEEAVTVALPERHAVAASRPAAADAAQPGPSSAAAQQDAGEPPATAAGGAVGVPHDDDAAICASLFSGLVFFLG